MTYAAEEVWRQIARGPHPDEDFYRLHVSGNGETKTLNVSREKLVQIAAILDRGTA